MKKILTILLCAVLLLSLCACKDKKDAAVKKPGGKAPVVADGKVKKPDSKTPAATDGKVKEAKAGETKEETSGDIDMGDGIILPEDGKITFGQGDSNTQTPAQQSQSTTGGDKTDPAPSGDKTDPAPTDNPSTEGDGYSGLEWNQGNGNNG